MSEASKQKIRLPEGMRDILFDEAENRREVERRLNAVYENAGYSEVITPVLEYGTVFGASEDPSRMKALYKLTEAGGELAVLRADNTMPMARVAATKLREAPLPLKLYYNQDIYRVSGDYSGHRNEIRQSGVELIGASGQKSDFMIVTLAYEALKSIGVPFKLEIGNVKYYNALIASLTMEEEERAKIRELVDSKNAVSLGLRLSGEGLEKIRRIPLLFGGSEVFAEAEALASGCEEALKALDEVRTLYQMLSDAGMGDSIMIDLGIVNAVDYYTGIVFRGYLDGAGEQVLSGGRYDQLLSGFGVDLPATGFAVQVGLAADTLTRAGFAARRRVPDAILHYSLPDAKTALTIRNRLTEEGKIVVLSPFDTIEETASYAKARRIAKVITVENGAVKEETI